MKIIQVFKKAILNLFIKLVPGLGVNAKNPPSSHALIGDAVNDLDLEDEDQAYDDEFEGWARVYRDPFSGSENNSDTTGGEHISLVE